MNFLWKSDRNRSYLNVRHQGFQGQPDIVILTLINSLFPFSSVPRAWFLKTTSSSHLRLTLNALGLSKGFPSAMSSSRCSCACWACSASSLAFCSARSRFIFSSSRIRSAVSSSSSLSSSLLSDSSPSESASISRVSSRILRRFASGSSSSSSLREASSSRFAGLGGLAAGSLGVPLVFAKCAASAARSSALRSFGSGSAAPP